MILKNQRNMLDTLTKIIYTAMLCQNLFQWVDLSKFKSDKYDDNSFRDSVLGVNLEYPK